MLGEMALRLLVVGLVGLALAGCVPTPAGRATASPAAPSARSTSSAAATALPSDPSTAGPTGSPSFVRPTPRPSPTFLVYEVRAGDTLTSVARQFGTTARSIAYWNRSRYPSLDPDSPTYQPGLIKVGWLLLVIPTAVVDEDELPELTPEPTPDRTPSSTPAG
jgi:hypothetical protein